MSRNIRTFSTFGRSLLRTPKFARHNGPIDVQHVRIVKPYFTRLRVKKMTLTVLMMGFIWHKLGQLNDDEEEEETRTEQLKEAVQQVKVNSGAEKVGPDGAGAEQLEGTEARAVDETSGDEVDEDDLVPEEQPEDAWFIPLGLAKQVPQTFYKASDPEWESFLKFAHDPKRKMLVKKELVAMVGKQIVGLKNFRNFLGTPVMTGKHWLDFDYPDGPPPEYERAGIEITEDYIAYTIRPVDPINISRLQQALWPRATGSSIWASCSMFVKLQTAKVRKALNLEDSKPSDKKQNAAGLTGVPPLIASQSNVPSQSSSQGDTKVEPPSMVSTTPSPGSDSLEPGKPWILRPLPTVPKPNTELSKATTAFKHSLVKNWKNPSVHPPRGTFVMSGLIEVFGPKGQCTLDVRAAYDPSESQFVAVSIALRRIVKNKQSPRR